MKRINYWKTFFVATTFLLVANIGHADTYQIDPVHSTIGFSIKHLGVSNVTGQFTDYTGTVEFDPENLLKASAELTIKAKSIDTNNEQRDEHLRNPDFFDVEKYPEITFKSAEIKQWAEGYLIIGDLTIHGVTKRISIPATISGPVKHPMGGEVLGVSAVVTINRQDFGITWSKQLDNVGLMLGDEVQVTVNLEAVKK